MDQAAASSSAAPSASPRRDASLEEVLDEATSRLQRMDISSHDVDNGSPMEDVATRQATELSDRRHVELLQLQLDELKRRLVDVVQQREDGDVIFQRAMQYAAAKGTANAVLHTLFDQASAGKYQVLEQWVDTGVIPTRDGLKHWRLDLRELRNETGATLLHVAVDSSIARQTLKLKCVELLVDRVGFNVDVRDAFGRTPLHVAAMAGYADVTQALLARGADATLRDRAGLSPLSVVRTLSRPPEDVVQLLAAAESGSARQARAVSDRILPQTAIASTLFLRTMSRFVRPHVKAEFANQTRTLLEVLLTHKHELTVAFDQLLRDHMSLLFERRTHAKNGQYATETHRVQSLVRLNSIFLNDMYRDPHFVDELKVEAATYGHSLVNTTSTSVVARAGATWEGILLKLIQAFKVAQAIIITLATNDLEQTSETQASSISERENGSFLSVSSASTTSPPPPRSPIYADQTSTTHTRQAWHYAVLFKSSTQPFPGFLSVKKGHSIVTCSEDVSRFFPLHDRLLISSIEYHCVSYDPSTRTIHLDREFEGASAAETKAYLAGSCSPLLPPYIASKRIWEREPGNKYEDHLSSEQDLFQDYQFLDPDSDYEVAVKLGPVPSAREARAVVDEWKAQARRLFEDKKCLSGLASCQHYCPQRSGHSLCVETMAAIGRDIAKERFGRATYSKQLKPRASLQKYQDLFLGKASWPGSPSSSAASHLEGETNTKSPPPDFT